MTNIVSGLMSIGLQIMRERAKRASARKYLYAHASDFYPFISAFISKGKYNAYYALQTNKK